MKNSSINKLFLLFKVLTPVDHVVLVVIQVVLEQVVKVAALEQAVKVAIQAATNIKEDCHPNPLIEKRTLIIDYISAKKCCSVPIQTHFKSVILPASPVGLEFHKSFLLPLSN